uniref:Uncharacterized protein n=1 Tax=Knipowitschia caucasica TaxID=637954 RepID=A0AAV2LHH1_KNICA
MSAHVILATFELGPSPTDRNTSRGPGGMLLSTALARVHNPPRGLGTGGGRGSRQERFGEKRRRWGGGGLQTSEGREVGVSGF